MEKGKVEICDYETSAPKIFISEILTQSLSEDPVTVIRTYLEAISGRLYPSKSGVLPVLM